MNRRDFLELSAALGATLAWGRSGARESQLQAALMQAQQGVKATTVDEAHADAKRAMDTLQAH